MNSDGKTVASGGCLCGAVKYEVRGELMDVVNCHCSKCRKFHGHMAAYSATENDNLVITLSDGLKWYRSPKDETPGVYRGFCMECGSSLFWDPRGKPHISIAAGSLDAPETLKTIRHVWVSQKADYYQIYDDLPQFEEGFARKDDQ